MLFGESERECVHCTLVDWRPDYDDDMDSVMVMVTATICDGVDNDGMCNVCAITAVIFMMWQGGITLRPRTPICNVHCDDGMQFQLLACVSGQLLEANERLAANPAMMNEAVRELNQCWQGFTGSCSRH